MEGPHAKYLDMTEESQRMHILHPHATTLLLHSCLTLFPGGSHRHRFLTLTFRSGVVKPERTSTKRAHEIPPRSTREDEEVLPRRFKPTQWKDALRAGTLVWQVAG